MKCIILAAGQGKRIDQVTKNKPKCLIKINKETLLERQIKLLNHLKLKKITIVKGFMAEKIKFKSVDYVYNKKYKTSEQLESFFSAKKKLNEDVLVTFGDIIYELSLVKKLISSKVGDIILATDKNWKKRYKIRYDHPFSQADKVNVVNGVKVMGAKNILNKLALTASSLYAKNLSNFLNNLYDTEKKDIYINQEDEIINKTLINKEL